MGNGTAPGGIDLDDLPTIDDGTSARIGSPEPGPIGLDARSGDTQDSSSRADQIVSYAQGQQGSKVGDGQCFALADTALRNAHAKSAADFGRVSPNADYKWGTPVTFANLAPGDIIQFRNYTYEKVVVTRDAKGTTTTEEDGDRPHHTAIVQSVDGDGVVTVLEQNAPDGSPVTRAQLYFTSGTTSSGNRTTTVHVHGTFRFYRAEAR
jgi:surface antigen